MLTSIQSAGVAPEVNLRTSAQARKHASKKSTLALKPRADVTRSLKQGYQWPHKKDSCPPKIFKKKNSPIRDNKHEHCPDISTHSTRVIICTTPIRSRRYLGMSTEHAIHTVPTDVSVNLVILKSVIFDRILALHFCRHI